MGNVWYYAEGNKSVGPVSLADLTAILSRVSSAKDVLVWRDGFANWEKAKNVPELVAVVIRLQPIKLPISHPPINQASELQKADSGNSQKSAEPLLVVDSTYVPEITNPTYLIYKATIANRLLIIFLAILLSAILSQLYLLDQIHSLVTQYGLGQVPEQLMPAWSGFTDSVLEIISFCWYFVLLACLMYCFYQLNLILRGYFRETMKYSFGWTVGSMFIPFVCLYRPWVGLAEIRKKIFVKRFNIPKSFDMSTLYFAVVFFIGVLSVKGVSIEMENLVKKDVTPEFYTTATSLSLLYAGIATLVTLATFFYCRSAIVSIQKTIS